MSTLSDEITDEIIEVKPESITKLQNEKLSAIPMPKSWHVKIGSLEWLDEGLGERIIVLEKHIKQKTSSEEKASSEQKASVEKTASIEKNTSIEKTISERIKNAAKYRQLYRIAIYNGQLLKDSTDKEITGQTLVLFFRPNNRISRQQTFWDSGISLVNNFRHEEYQKCFSGLDYISDNSVPSVSFLKNIDTYSKMSPEFERISSLTEGSTPLLWSEFQKSVEIPVGCFPKKLTSMVLNYFLNNNDMSQDEYAYLLSVVTEEELTPEQQEQLILVEQNYKIALERDQDTNWVKLKDSVVKYHAHSLKQYNYYHSDHKKDYSILAYDIACAIEKFAPKRIKYAFELLEIMTDTFDWDRSDRESPYVYLALSKCCDLLMGAEFSSVAEKRYYVNKYLKSFVTLMTDEEDSSSPDVIAALRLILSYSCGFYDLESDDTDPFQNIGVIQGTDRENLKNIFVTLLEMIRNFRKNGAIEAIAPLAKAVIASGKDSFAVPSKEKSEKEELPTLDDDLAVDDTLELSIESKEKAETSISLPKGLSIVTGDLRNVGKELVLLKRELSSKSFETEKSAMYEKHRKLQVLYIGFAPAKYDLFSFRKDVVEHGQRYSEESYQTVLFIFGDPEISNLQRKSVKPFSSAVDLHNYTVLLSWFSKFRVWPLDLENQIKDILNTGLAPEDPVTPESHQDLQHFSIQIGRMPNHLCKTVFEFLVTREVMPAEYLDFLMQFAIGHELSYRLSAVNRIHHYVSSRKYTKAVNEARDITLDILEHAKAIERSVGNQELWNSDSALAWDLALELEKVSPYDALDALKIIFREIPENQAWSFFEVMAMDKFCEISLKLFIEGGRKNLQLIEEALDVSLQRLEKTCLPAVLIFVKLIEAATDLKVDRKELSKLAPDPEYMSGYGEALAIVLSTLTDYIYETRKEIITKMTMSHEKDAIPLDLQSQSLPGLGLTGYTVIGSGSGTVTASKVDAISEAETEVVEDKSEATAPSALQSGNSSGEETELEKEHHDFKKPRKFE